MYATLLNAYTHQTVLILDIGLLAVHIRSILYVVLGHKLLEGSFLGGLATG